MDTRYLKTLVTVVETGSFSKAAQILHLTQSAVSQRIKFLEDAFACSLFDRSSGGLGLTSAGNIVLESAQRILEIQESLFGRLKRSNGRRKITLSCTPTFGTTYLSGVLNRFILSNGSGGNDLSFMLTNPNDALAGLISREMDISVIEHCPRTDLGVFKSYDLPDDELVFVSSPQLACPQGQLELKDLLKHTLFVRESGCSSRKLLIRGLEDQGRSLDDFATVVTSDDLRLTCQTILSGAGICYMSKCLVCEYLATGQMVEHRVDGFPESRQRKILIEKGRETEKLLQDLIRCIFNVMDVPSPI